MLFNDNIHSVVVNETPYDYELARLLACAYYVGFTDEGGDGLFIPERVYYSSSKDGPAPSLDKLNGLPIPFDLVGAVLTVKNGLDWWAELLGLDRRLPVNFLLGIEPEVKYSHILPILDAAENCGRGVISNKILDLIYKAADEYVLEDEGGADNE